MFIFFSLLPLVIWLYLTFLHGGFWRADQRLGAAPAPEAWPRVTAVIPARDEVASIWPVIASHLATDYSGPFDVVLVDDHSSDGTADLAHAAANHDPRLTVITPPPLPTGWTGKLWALHHGINTVEAREEQPHYLLLTDADIVHAAGVLQKLVAKAEHEDLALVSLMARLDARGVWGKTLIPAFIYFFMKLYPFARANDPAHTLAAAAGGCMLVRADRLQETGGIEAIKDNLIDDCALASQIKNTPPRAAIFLGLADSEVVSLRDNRSLASVWTMVARTAYTQLGYSPLKVIGTLIGMILVYVCAPLLLLAYPIHGNVMAFWISLITIVMMLTTYIPTIRLYKLPLLTITLLPLAAIAYAVMTFSSARRHQRGTGGQWKGRSYQGKGQ